MVKFVFNWMSGELKLSRQNFQEVTQGRFQNDVTEKNFFFCGQVVICGLTDLK